MQAADLNWLEVYFIPQNTASAIKTGVEEEEKRRQVSASKVAVERLTACGSRWVISFLLLVWLVVLPPHLSFRYSTVFILTHEFSHFYSYFLPNPTAVECEEAGKRLYGCLARMKTTVYPADLFSEPKAVIATCLAPESLYLAIFKQILLEWDFHTWIFYAKFDLKKGLSKHWQKKSLTYLSLWIFSNYQKRYYEGWKEKNLSCIKWLLILGYILWFLIRWPLKSQSTSVAPVTSSHATSRIMPAQAFVWQYSDLLVHVLLLLLIALLLFFPSLNFQVERLSKRDSNLE